jgi:hypothetical protein
LAYWKLKEASLFDGLAGDARGSVHANPHRTYKDMGAESFLSG